MANSSETKPEDLWLYLDAQSGQQKGPLREPIVKRLIRRGILQPNQFVWTARLTEWATLATVEPFASYCAHWTTYWYYMADAEAPASVEGAEDNRKGPVQTADLVALFVDGEIDGMTLVWCKDLPEWKPVSDVPELKEFLHDANEDLERQAEVLETQEHVDVKDQVYEDAAVEAFVAEDGKQYVFDADTKKWITPQDKIEDDLEALREAVGETAPVIEAKPAKNSALENPKTAQAKDAEAENERKTVDAGSAQTESANEAPADGQEKKKRKKKKKSDKWKKTKSNTWVYVNGLPLDVAIQEVHDHFAKCGVIQTDLVTTEPRIKLYKNKDYGGLNGDGSVCFMKEASVELAVQLLDKSQIRPDWTIDVSPAEFKQKGDGFVKRKKPKLDSRAKVKRIEQEKALSWNEGEDGDRGGLRIVVIKHMFSPDEIEDEAYENELKEDIQFECLKIGETDKITIFPKRADGVVVIKFASSGSAAQCVDVMNGRFFAGRKLECGFWDGTDYTYRESKDEEKQRSEKFEEWLEEGSSSEEEEEESGIENSTVDDRGDKVLASGRVLPPLDDEDDSDDEDTSEPSGAEVHAGRILPPLDDEDEDDD